MRKPNRNLQYRDIVKKSNLARSFSPEDHGVEDIARTPTEAQAKMSSLREDKEERSISIRTSQAYLRATPERTSRMFDMISYHSGDNGGAALYNLMAVGGYVDFPIYEVPVGQRLVIQNYIFWVEIDNRPVNPYPVIAEPSETFNRLSFNLLINDSPAIVTRWTRRAGPPPFLPIITGDGVLNTSKFPYGDSDPNSPSVTIVATGGTRVSFRIRRISVDAMYRLYYGVACRIRGFISSDIDKNTSEH